MSCRTPIRHLAELYNFSAAFTHYRAPKLYEIAGQARNDVVEKQY
jgi:hypothetical protein